MHAIRRVNPWTVVIAAIIIITIVSLVLGIGLLILSYIK